MDNYTMWSKMWSMLEMWSISLSSFCLLKNKKPFSIKGFERLYYGAVEKTRTSTGIHPLPPQNNVYRFIVSALYQKFPVINGLSTFYFHNFYIIP